MSDQFVLLQSTHNNCWWSNTLLIPAYFSVFSVLFLIFQSIFSSSIFKSFCSKVGFQQQKQSQLQVVTPLTSDDHTESIKQHGVLAIFIWNFLRFVGCLVLLALTIVIVVASSKRDNKENVWYQLSLSFVFLYTSLLSLKPSNRTSPHLTSLLLVTFLIFAYRDIWPLATYTLTPADASEGLILWIRLIILSFVGVVIPLLIPRQYIPLDPKNPQSEPNPEQTSSLLSFLLFTFLDPIIFYAYRHPHLPFDKLPPLCDYDRTEHLVNRSFYLLDPYLHKSPRYIFWNLMILFWKEYSQLSIMLTIKVIAGFLAPLTINRLLTYVENGGVGAIVRPWVWILGMFLGPVIGTVAMQYYIFITTGTLVRVEGIITQLVFEHSLRVRMVEKPEGSSGDTSSTTTASTTTVSTTGTSTPLLTNDRDESNESSQVSETLIGSVSDGKKKASTGTPAVITTPVPGPSAGGENEKTSSSSNLVGKINNLVTVDTGNIVEARDFLFIVLYAPLELALCCWFLFAILDWSAVVGIVTLLVCFPLPGYVARLVNDVQKERMKRTDARTQNVTEVMSVLRMIKVFAWETKIQEQMNEKREEELKWVKRRTILQLVNGTLNYLIPLLSLLTTYTTYTLVWKNDLTASRVFSSMAVFDMLRDQLHMIFWMIPNVIQGKVSLDRVDDFLRNSELLDEFKDSNSSIAQDILSPDAQVGVGSLTGGGDGGEVAERIGFQDATFSWSDEDLSSPSSLASPGITTSGTLTPSRRSFRLRIEGDLFFKRGKTNLIIGPTGSGKTSILYALLGEMHFIPTEPRSWFHLPREGGVAYAAQESWVQNETVKENILFGSPMDEERYQKVLYQCGLEQDLGLFEAGDNTEVGEKGLTLSGGQKARITLARAIYSKAEILLLDDVLAALDVHTAKWIIDKCFKGDLVKGRTVLLVTHNVTLASPIAEYVVSLGLDGRIQSRGSIDDALRYNSKLLDEVTQNEEVVEKAKETVDDADKDRKAGGKLIVAEEMAEGHVRWPALKLYFVSLGGWLFWTVVLVGDLLACILTTLQTWYLGYWARQYETHESPDVPVWKYLGGYSLLLLGACVFWVGAFIVFFLGSVRAARKIYNTLTSAILGTTLRWLDVTPTSRVIARCTQDVRAIDGPVAGQLADIIDICMWMMCRLAGVVIVTPLFLIPGLVVGVVGGWCGQVYIAAQLSVKREMSNARSPVLGHFGAAISGLTSLRAYGAQGSFRRESMVRIDKYIRAGRSFYNLNRWISIRIDTLGALFASTLAVYLVYLRQSNDASTIGFALNMAVGFSGVILWLVRIVNEFEVQGNSLERIQDYIEIEQEPKPTESGKPPAYWPASGSIHVENLCARYSSDGPEVLHNLSFAIKAGERIGVVGRTGSGKSSLTLSLLRCILTSGTVLYDGIKTSDINLDALRSNITIIPQQPELLTGTLRQNLDPFGQHDDAMLNDALRSAGLFSLQEEGDEARIGLDSPIASGGSNLSVGQRQILALARAIIRGSKLLILDEATSAIDYDTDNIIQTSIRNELKDVTLITIAHRLQTIMDADRIMVLKAGNLEEYDTPSNLLKDSKGLLRALVDESGDREKLYEMAGVVPQ